MVAQLPGPRAGGGAAPGRTLHGRAHVVPTESTTFQESVERTFRRVPGLGRQFGIRYDRRAGLTPAQRRTVAANAVVVSIDLDRTAG